MKRSFNKAAFAVMAMLVAILIGGCSKEKAPFKDLGVYDKTVSEDQLCTLEIGRDLLVNKFNDKKLSWWYDAPDESDYNSIIKIPAGSHTLTAYFSSSYNKMIYSVAGLTISHNFIAGRTYRLLPQLHKENGDVLETWTRSDLPDIKTATLKIVEKGN